MDIEVINELNTLIEDVINSYTKADAASSLRRLEFLSGQVKPQVNPYAAEKLSQAVNYAKSAAGSVAQKEKRMANAKQAWYLFEREVDVSD